jgi:hypothetical protein
VKESMIMQGQYVSTTTKEVATLEKVNGVPMLTKIVADGSCS